MTSFERGRCGARHLISACHVRTFTYSPCFAGYARVYALIDYHSLRFFVHSGYQSPLGLKGSIYYLLFPQLVRLNCTVKTMICSMNVTYSICFPLLLAGLFGLVFVLVLANKGKGKKGKTTPTSLGGGGGLKSCATAGCHNRFSHHDSHELCFSCCGRAHLILFCEDCNHLSFATLQLRAIRLALVLPPNVSSVEVGLDQLGELIGGRAYAQQWFANWNASYFNRDPVQPPCSHSTAGTPVVLDNFAGDTSSSASPTYPIMEDLEAGLDVSTGHVGTTDRTLSAATLPPATTPLVGLSQVRQALSLSLGRSPFNKTAFSRPVMGDGSNQPDLSRLGTQTSDPSGVSV